MSDDMIQCSSCTEMHQGVPEGALPSGWDMLFVPMEGAHLFCPECLRFGRMEHLRALNGLPRRQHWRLPDAVMAVYRPAARQVLIATPDGMAELSEEEADRLRDALTNALAMRHLAGTLLRGAA
jgi:late competence protein required for DNA uptake (superfamily II DNA/RNA helicase)